MKKTNVFQILLLGLLTVLILLPLCSIFAKAVIPDGRLDLFGAWKTLGDGDNLKTVGNSLLLGFSVVLCASFFALPTAFLLSRTQIG